MLSYDDYIKKVKRRQSWNALAFALSESLDASQAGYSSSSTSTSSSSFTNSYGSSTSDINLKARSMNFDNDISLENTSLNGEVRTRSRTRSTSNSYSNSSTSNYDGTQAYLARQNAKKNTSNFIQSQYQIKNRIAEGYAKLHTIDNETEYLGYVNVSYTKSDDLRVKIPFDNYDYSFSFNLNSKFIEDDINSMAI